MVDPERLQRELTRIKAHLLSHAERCGRGLPPDVAPQDLVAIAIGTLAKPDGFPGFENLLLHLRRNIETQAKVARRRGKRREAKQSTSAESGVQLAKAGDSPMSDGEVETASAESVLIAREQAQAKEKLFKLVELRASMERDDEIGLVLMALRDGLEQPVEISDETGLDVAAVKNARRRLRRMMEQVLAEEPGLKAFLEDAYGRS